MNDRIQVIERAFKILEEIALDTSRPRTVGELAKETGLKIQTLSKIVRTMTVLGYLENVGRKSGYVLGEKFLQLSGGYREFDDLRPLVQPYLKKYAETVGEYISFSVLRGYYKHIVCRIRAKEADPRLRWHFPTEENPFDSLSGICLVARVGRAKQLKFCRKYPHSLILGRNQRNGVSREDEADRTGRMHRSGKPENQQDGHLLSGLL